MENVMPYALIALLDRPSERSFGMVPILVRDGGSGLLIVYGLEGGPRPLSLPGHVTAQEFIDGNCRNVEACAASFPEEPLGRAAAWLGTEFLEDCRSLHAPEPVIPNDALAHADARDHRTPGGVFWIEDAADVYRRLDEWLRSAAEAACRKKCHEIASLMHWCLPDRVETHAAIWFTAPDLKHRERELEWFIRTWYAQREPALTKSALEKRLAQVAESILAPRPT